MKFAYIVAGILSLATAALHVFGGGPEFHDPMLQSGAVTPLKAMFSILWHVATAMFVLNGAALLLVSRSAPVARLLGTLIFAQYTAFAILFLWYGYFYFGSIWPLSQWLIFVTINVVIAFGLINTSDSEKAKHETAKL